MVEDKPKKKQRKWWRRIVIFVALILMCWVVLFAILKWWFPEQLAIRYATNYIQNKYNVTVIIEDASIDPFARIEINRLAITYKGDNEPLFYVTSVKFSYNIWSLLFHRHLKIQNIVLDSPMISIGPMANGQWNIIALLEQFETQEKSPLEESKDSNREFPIQIQLKKFEMNDIRLSLAGSLNKKDVMVVFGPIDFQLSDVTGNSIDNLQGKGLVNSTNCRLLSTIHKPHQFDFECFIGCDIAVGVTPGIIDFSLKTSIHPNYFNLYKPNWQTIKLPDLSLFTSLTWNRNQNTISCTSFNVTSEPFHLDMQAEAALDSTPNWSLSIAPTSFDIASMIDRAISLNLPGLESLNQLPDIKGSIGSEYFNITGSGIDPKSPDFQATLSGAASIDMPTISMTQPVALQVKQFVNAIEFGADLSGMEIKSAYANINGGIAEIQSDSILFITSVDSITWNTQLALDEYTKQLQVELTGGIGTILNGTCELAMQSTVDLPQLLNQDLEALKQFDLRCVTKGIDTDQIGQGKWGGAVTAELQIYADDITFPKGDGKLFLQSPWALINEQKSSFPDIEQTVDFHSQVDLDKQHITISPIHWEWSDIAWADIFMETTYPDFRVGIDQAFFDLAKFYAVIPRSILPQIEMEFPSGVAEVKALVEGSIEDISGVKFEVNVSIDSVTLSTLQPELSVENIQVNLELNGGMQSAKGKVQLFIDSGGMPNIFPDMLEGVFGVVSFQYRSPDKVLIDSLSFTVPAFAVSGNGSANFDLEQIPPGGLVNFNISVNDDNGITILDTISYVGNTTMFGRVYLQQNRISFNGDIDLSNVNIKIGSMASVRGLTGRIPISQKYDLSSSRIDTEPLQRIAHRAMGLNSYPSLQTSYQWNMEDYGTIEIDSVQVMDYGISDLTTDIMLKSGYLEIPSVQCKAYGGNLHGDLWVSLNDLNPDSLQCGVRLNAAGIQTAKILATSKHDSMESIICADADLVVSGFPGTVGFDIQGSADVTRIGRGVALDLLQIMDPEGQDEGIQSTRTFLRQGWGVKVFSFRIRDGFVYSSMVPTAPPPSKLHMFLLSKIVHLPPQITYGRIPLKFLLQMQGTEE